MIKKFLYLTLILFLTAGIAYAKDITFAWDANSESDLAGYKIYRGKVESGSYDETLDVGHDGNKDNRHADCQVWDPFKAECCETIWPGFTDGTWYIAATAFDKYDNESAYSVELVITVDTQAPGAPGNFRLTLTEAKAVSVEVD